MVKVNIKTLDWYNSIVKTEWCFEGKGKYLLKQMKMIWSIKTPIKAKEIIPTPLQQITKNLQVKMQIQLEKKNVKNLIGMGSGGGDGEGRGKWEGRVYAVKCTK